MTQKKPLKRIKSGFFDRSLSLAKIAFSTGTQIASEHIQKSLNSGSQEELWKKVLAKNASYFTKELGELKGSLMKAGQMLSMYGEHFLPAEANDFLKTLQSDSPALEWVAIKKIIEQQLSAELISELEIEETALASASMGQVHRAKIKSTEEWIVLKIQYPNVDTAIENDLKVLRKFLQVLQILPKNFNLDPVFKEIKSMLTQETNYSLEATLTEEFYELLKQDSRFIVPKVFKKYSTPKILATSYEKGLRADDPQVQALPQEQRNQLSLNFLDLYYKEIFDWKVVQTDPHLGNYKIRIDKNSNKHQIILFDFGATRKYSDEFILPYLRMIKACHENQSAHFQAAAKELKLIYNEDDPKLLKHFEEFCFETVEPFRDLIYDWKNTDLPQRLSKKGLQMVKDHAWRTPPSELLFLDRKTGGVFIFCSCLKAKMNSHSLLSSYTSKIQP